MSYTEQLAAQYQLNQMHSVGTWRHVYYDTSMLHWSTVQHECGPGIMTADWGRERCSLQGAAQLAIELTAHFTWRREWHLLCRTCFIRHVVLQHSWMVRCVYDSTDRLCIADVLKVPTESCMPQLCSGLKMHKKGEAVFVHTTKAYRGSKHIAPLMLHLGSKRETVSPAS